MAEGGFDRNWLIENAKNQPITWNKTVPNTRLEKFQNVIEIRYHVNVDTYWKLYKWSIDNFEKFWEEVWYFFRMKASMPYDQAFRKTGLGDRFENSEWFPGARLNFAENILKCRDDRIALVCLDELGNEEMVTYAEMFQQVTLYAAAFRKNGMGEIDTVACYISNRKEAIFAMLATASMGAYWGGLLPYYGSRIAFHTLQLMRPRFLITVDSHQDNGKPQSMLDLVHKTKDIESIQKVILVVTDQNTYTEDFSSVPKCVFLRDFLEEGRNPDETVPDIVFKQLPLDHPICINFTSGLSTQRPTGVMHSAGTLLAHMRDFGLHYNMDEGDALLSLYPPGWSIWSYFLSSLAMNMKLVLYCGSPYYKVRGRNFWDILAKYDVKFTFLITSIVDKMEEKQIFPSADSNLDCLQIIGIGGTPVKNENIHYLQRVTKDTVIANLFGFTEVFGTFSGLCLNMPIYGCEIQVPGLGMDIQCYNSEGVPTTGEIGEFVVRKPAPNFPVRLLHDCLHGRLVKLYLTKFPNVWSQNEECWINPKTRGFIITGRNDDYLNPKGLLFEPKQVYFALFYLLEIKDYICVSQRRSNGDSRAVLFVRINRNYRHIPWPPLQDKVKTAIEQELCAEYCVPELILPIPDIPYADVNTNSRMESMIRKILETNEIPREFLREQTHSIRSQNRTARLQKFLDIPEILSYNRN